jgi:hypothetical protein
VKGKIMHSSLYPNLLSIINTLLDIFKKKLLQKVIVGLWRRALKNAKKYFESDKSIQFFEEEFDAQSNSDYNHMS